VDLLATDQSYKETWSIQVKTNRKAGGFWLLSKSYKEDVSKRLIYVFVNLRGDQRPDYYVVPSWHVAKHGRSTPPRTTGSIWHAYYKPDAKAYSEKWSVFGVRKSVEGNPED